MAILGTTALRREYAPPCTGPFARIELHGEGAIHVQPRCATAFQALNACLVAWGYETRQADTGAYVCRTITNGTGYSLHAFAIAADINWSTNPYGPRLVTDMPSGMVRAIKAIRTMSGRQVFGWGGDYRTNKDAMHFEIVCPRADLETGINAATVPGGNHPIPDPIIPPAEQDWFDMASPAELRTVIREELEDMAKLGLLEVAERNLTIFRTPDGRQFLSNGLLYQEIAKGPGSVETYKRWFGIAQNAAVVDITEEQIKQKVIGVSIDHLAL